MYRRDAYDPHMIEVRTTVVDEDEVDTLLTEDVEFHGVIRTSKSLMIKGKVEGRIESSSDVYIEPEAWITGSITAGAIIIRGSVWGSLSAQGTIELLPGCSVEGDLEAPDIVIAEGAFHKGQCMGNLRADI